MLERGYVMDAQVFWNIIGNYNQATLIWQCMILALIITSLILAYFQKAIWFPKITLGIANIFIGIVFFIIFGTEPIQTYFAAPLYIAIGCLFIYEAIKYRTSGFNKPGIVQWMLLCLIIVYPLVSFLLGHSFPQLVVYIMPCPIISLSIVIYSCYNHKNKLLLLLMTIWGLTGVKAFFANALEDIILLICGFYCLYIFITEIREKHHSYGMTNIKTKVVRVSSCFPASIDEIWGELQRSDTLHFIAAPYVAFNPIGNTELTWKEGEISKFHLKLFGFISIGIHTINVVQLNKDTLTIYTNEKNESVPVWNHRIFLQRVHDNVSLYTDEVEIYAGWKTPIVFLWGHLFYRHRQKKWIKLLRNN